jgi:hypothetical protein
LPDLPVGFKQAVVLARRTTFPEIARLRVTLNVAAENGEPEYRITATGGAALQVRNRDLRAAFRAFREALGELHAGNAALPVIDATAEVEDFFEIGSKEDK